MIARLAGTLVSKQPPHMVIDVAGVGYEVEAPLPVFVDLPETGQPVVILTHLSVKEDSHTLYGFATSASETRTPGSARAPRVGRRWNGNRSEANHRALGA